MTTTILSSKGQVVLPRAIRASKQWKAGTRFTVEATSEGVLLRPERAGAPTSIEDLAGCLKYRGKAKTLEDMQAAIEKEAKRHALD